MLYDPATTLHLKPWLVRTLEPMYVVIFFIGLMNLCFSSFCFYTIDGNRCDAEPGALADYILALLKHNVPESEMRLELAVQLDEFLEKGSFEYAYLLLALTTGFCFQNAPGLLIRFSLS